MIYDCFPFFNELDILDIRFDTLYNTVDKFVIVEADKTFSGNSKPLYFQENRKRWKKYEDKIIYLLADNMPSGNTQDDHWAREVYQKDFVAQGFASAQPDDWIILSDADEIPRPSIIRSVVENNISPAALNMTMYYYYINLMSTSPWAYAKMIKKSDFDKLNCGFFHFRNWIKTEITLPNAGWHFTYQGDVDNMIYKIKSLATQEVNTEEIRNNFHKIVESHKNIFVEGHDHLFSVPIDQSFPQYVIENYGDKKKVSETTNTLEFETNYWGNCLNTFDEDQKQYTYAEYMGLPCVHYTIDAQRKSVLDIGGGPTSMLLKCANLKIGKVVDPLPMPQWVLMRYSTAEILVEQICGEDIQEKGWDEVWIYNCLQHTKDPEQIIKNAKLAGKTVRIFEWIDAPISPGHFHTLTKKDLDTWLGINGETIELLEERGCTGTAYYGVYNK